VPVAEGNRRAEAFGRCSEPRLAVRGKRGEAGRGTEVALGRVAHGVGIERLVLGIVELVAQQQGIGVARRMVVWLDPGPRIHVREQGAR